METRRNQARNRPPKPDPAQMVPLGHRISWSIEVTAK